MLRKYTKPRENRDFLQSTVQNIHEISCSFMWPIRTGHILVPISSWSYYSFILNIGLFSHKLIIQRNLLYQRKGQNEPCNEPTWLEQDTLKVKMMKAISNKSSGFNTALNCSVFWDTTELGNVSQALNDYLNEMEKHNSETHLYNYIHHVYCVQYPEW